MCVCVCVCVCVCPGGGAGGGVVNLTGTYRLHQRVVKICTFSDNEL